jgi:hypothetical protein
MTQQELKHSIRLHIENLSRGTMGYKDAADKDSFMTGVNVALSMYFDYADDQLTKEKTLNEALAVTLKNTQEEIITIARILNKYSDL